jgi:poly [ADP-ribose] polymerase
MVKSGEMKNNIYLMFVGVDGTQSNKFYNMIDTGRGFTAEYGRMGSSKTSKSYPAYKWDSVYRSKVKKGYRDISELKKKSTTTVEASGNKAFDEFHNVFKSYTGNMVKSSYLVDGCSQLQIDEAQSIINNITKLKTISKINDNLMELYKIIPRRMGNVRDHLVSDISDKGKFIMTEQTALDSMDSSNIIHESNILKGLGVGFTEVKNHKKMEELLYPTMDKGYTYGSRDAKIHKVYAIHDEDRTNIMEEWVDKQEDKSCKLLIHGTRNPNIFSILKSGLLVRPSNAHFSGAVYGDGVYHSSHSAKSLGYTGYDTDKLFLIQNVHMGNHYTYSGYYRNGKDISRSDMNYKSLRNKGKYDSLYVEAGDGLLNSEYIIYNKEQTNTQFLVWMKG